MKYLSSSALPIVAALTLSLTAFTKTDTSVRRQAATNCYKDLTAVCLPGTLALIFDQTDCADVTPTLNKGAVSPANFASFLDCFQAELDFCCAQLTKIEIPLCPTQTRINFTDAAGIAQPNSYAKITAVFCRP